MIPFTRPDIGHDEIDRVRAVLESGWLTTGEQAHLLEREIAAYVGAKHAIALNSGTAALHLALEAIGLKAGDEVIVPAYTFTATAEVVFYFGAKPVIVDVDARTFNIDPDRVAEAVTERTKAIIAVHFGGLAADLDALRAIAKPRGIAIIDDAAHALQSRFRGRMVGAISDITCFSFYATKTLTTGEGGMLCTDDDDWAARARVMALHGISHDAWNRYRSEGSWYYEVVAPGYKYNMTDIAGALGLAQLAKLDRMRDRRQEIALRYNEAFGDDAAFEIPPFEAPEDHSWHLYALRLNAIDRAQFIERLRDRGIGTSVHFIPLHHHPFYRDHFGYTPDSFPVATRQYEREVSLPIYSLMSDDDVETVIRAVREAR
jgi:perosamine synthetase